MKGYAGTIRSRLFWLACGILLFAVANLFAQQTYTVPQDFDYSLITNALLDAGYCWERNSYFHPIDIFSAPSISDSSKRPLDGVSQMLASSEELSLYSTSDKGDRFDIYGIGGIELRDNLGTGRNSDHLAFTPFMWGFATFRQHWFTRFCARATNDSASLPHYKGVPRPISRAGMNTAEIDIAAFGFWNDWALVEFGRGREIWGPFEDNNLILSGNSPAWERFVMQGSFKKFTYRYTFGFLESIKVENDKLPVQRYLVGRALEYNNHHNLVIGLSEVTILSGVNRSIDLAHLNPLALELEVEQNKRENVVDNETNAVWIVSFDWLPHSRVRLSGSVLIDEFQFDNTDRKEGRTDLTAYIGRVAWTPLTVHINLTLFGEFTQVGTYTYQHGNPYCNFVSRGVLLGHPIGNDAEQIRTGLRLIPGLRTVLEIAYSSTRRGSNSILDTPYRPLVNILRKPFPSGTVNREEDVSLKLWFFPFHCLQFAVAGTLDIQRSKASNNNELTLLLRIRYP